MNRILWVDDEISLLKPHLLYLERKGYDISTATNGFDAVSMVKELNYDLVILDEMMVGMDGLETLRRIKNIDSSIKAIMVTKSEEEGIFLEAVGNMIDDYLTKPVSPLQLYLSIRKNIEKEDIVTQNLSRNYIKNYRMLSAMLEKEPDADGWIKINEIITDLSMKLDEIRDTNLTETFDDLRLNANAVFGAYIQSKYKSWLEDRRNGPALSTDIIDKYILKDIGKEKQALIIIDCFPYDQMSIVADVLKDNFFVTKESYYSILPTATEFARNAIFSGLMPSETEDKYPELFSGNLDDETSSNRYEKELLERQLVSKGSADVKLKYDKIYKIEEFAKLESSINEYRDIPLAAIVVNMVDFLIHSRKKDEIVSEMMVNESSYRATIKSWFENSSLLRVINSLGDLGFKIVLTTDHGAKLIGRYTKVSGDGVISPGLRMKYGKNLTTSNRKQTLFWQKPADYGMPTVFKGMNIILAKEDHCFVFEKGLNDFYKQIKNTYQHGGVSLEEMILPVLVLKKRS